jgi:hypothetical protein
VFVERDKKINHPIEYICYQVKKLTSKISKEGENLHSFFFWFLYFVMYL